MHHLATLRWYLSARLPPVVLSKWLLESVFPGLTASLDGNFMSKATAGIIAQMQGLQIMPYPPTTNIIVDSVFNFGCAHLCMNLRYPAKSESDFGVILSRDTIS